MDSVDRFHRVTLLPPAPTFSTTYHHPNIELSNYNSTARGSVKQWGTVLVDGVAVSSGVHRWKLHVRGSLDWVEVPCLAC